MVNDHMSGLSFQAAFPQMILRISEYSSAPDSPDYVLSILAEDGNVVESIDDRSLDSQVTEARGKAFKAMRDLYTSARRQAFGVEATLDQLLNTLDEQP